MAIYNKDMNHPLVSICIPTYNREALVFEAVQSALAQTYDSVEVLVSDDASSDQTIPRLKTIQDPRLVIYTKRLNSGMVDNWNRCLRLAKGHYIKYLASDDLLTPTCVEEMIQAAHDANVEFVCCAREIIDEKGVTRKVMGLAKQDRFIDGLSWARKFILNRRNTLGEPSAVLFKKSLIKKAGYFDPKLKQTVDAEYWLRLLLNTDGFYIHKPLCKFRIHSEANSSRAAANGWNVDDAYYLVDKYSQYRGNMLDVKIRMQRFLITISVQRDIRKLLKKGNRKLAGVLYNRLRQNLSFWEQVEFFLRHSIQYAWEKYKVGRPSQRRR